MSSDGAEFDAPCGECCCSGGCDGLGIVYAPGAGALVGGSVKAPVCVPCGFAGLGNAPVAFAFAFAPPNELGGIVNAPVGFGREDEGAGGEPQPCGCDCG